MAPGNALADTTAGWPSSQIGKVGLVDLYANLHLGADQLQHPLRSDRLAHLGVDRGHHPTEGRDHDRLLRLATRHSQGSLGFPYALPGNSNVLRSSADLQCPQPCLLDPDVGLGGGHPSAERTHDRLGDGNRLPLGGDLLLYHAGPGEGFVILGPGDEPSLEQPLGPLQLAGGQLPLSLVLCELSLRLNDGLFGLGQRRLLLSELGAGLLDLRRRRLKLGRQRAARHLNERGLSGRQGRLRLRNPCLRDVALDDRQPLTRRDPITLLDVEPLHDSGRLGPRERLCDPADAAAAGDRFDDAGGHRPSDGHLLGPLPPPDAGSDRQDSQQGQGRDPEAPELEAQLSPSARSIAMALPAGNPASPLWSAPPVSCEPGVRPTHPRRDRPSRGRSPRQTVAPSDSLSCPRGPDRLPPGRAIESTRVSSGLDPDQDVEGVHPGSPAVP